MFSDTESGGEVSVTVEQSPRTSSGSCVICEGAGSWVHTWLRAVVWDVRTEHHLLFLLSEIYDTEKGGKVKYLAHLELGKNHETLSS